MVLDRTSSPAELLVQLDRSARQPLGRQLENELRQGIRSGRLAPGSRLPSTRDLAGQLGVSRSVTVAAYEQLAAEGYIAVRQGTAPRVAARAVAAAPAAAAPAAAVPVRFDLRPGTPDLVAFPRIAWLRSFRAAIDRAPAAELGYGDPRGVADLREELAAYLGRVRGTVSDAGRIVAAGGFAQGLGIVCRVLHARGARRIGLEDPSHPGGGQIVARAGLEPVPVPVDELGLRVDLLAAADPDAVLLTPAHQFPTGVVLAPDRRAALLAWAERRGAIVIEDDYDAEHRYDRAPVGALQGLAPETVVYAGSVSKTLAPALRLGWLVLPGRLVDDVSEEKHLADLGSPRLDQLALADFLSRGELDRHLRRMRLRYRRRRDALVAAVSGRLPELSVEGIAAGLHAVLTLPEGSDEGAVVEACRRQGIALAGLGDYRLGAAGPPGLVVGYAQLPEPALRAAVAALARALSN